MPRKTKIEAADSAVAAAVPCSACEGTTWVRCKIYGWKPCLKCTPKVPDQKEWEAMMKPVFRLMKAKGIGAMTLIRAGNKGSFSLIPEQNDSDQATASGKRR